MQDGVTIYCIRHGQTDWNAQSRYQGQVDVPLNDTGRRQAKRNGEALKRFMPELANARFVSSPLGRARETMEIVRTCLGLDPTDYALDDRLKEVHYGEWQGQLLSTLKKTETEGLSARRADPFNFQPPHGESYSELSERMCEWLETVTTDCVVATHGGLTRTLRAHLLDLDPDGILDLEVPQDRVLVIRRGEMEWI